MKMNAFRVSGRLAAIGMIAFSTLLSEPAGLAAAIRHSGKVVNASHDIDRLAFGAGETLTFEFGWNGIPAAQMVVSARYENRNGRPVFRYMGVARTMSHISWAYKSEDHVEAIIDGATLQPLSYELMRNEGGAIFGTELIREDDRYLGRRIAKEKVTAVDVAVDGNYDPFSVAYLARSLPLKVGESYSFPVFDGKNHHLLTFVVEAREKVSISAGKFDTLRIRPIFENLSDPTKKKRISDATLWVSNDSYRVPVRLESKVFFGKVYGELKSFRPGTSLTLTKAD